MFRYFRETVLSVYEAIGMSGRQSPESRLTPASPHISVVAALRSTNRGQHSRTNFSHDIVKEIPDRRPTRRRTQRNTAKSDDKGNDGKTPRRDAARRDAPATNFWRTRVVRCFPRRESLEAHEK